MLLVLLLLHVPLLVLQQLAGSVYTTSCVVRGFIPLLQMGSVIRSTSRGS